MAIFKTRIVIVSQDATYEIPGDYNQSSVIANYSGSIPGIANMTCEETVATTPEGEVKTLTFRPRAGTKG